MNYAAAPADKLLHALEHAGRHPDPDLIRACLDRREEVTPGLLALFRKTLETDEHLEWDEDDPRHYREIHAGLLLIHLREPAALDGFRAYLSEERFENLMEWFESELPLYGPAAVPTMQALLEDVGAWVWGRIAAEEILGTIAQQHPETRPTVLEALRGQLPEVDDEGRLVLPEDKTNTDEEGGYLWTWLVYALARLGDEASVPVAMKLFERDLIDEMVFGDAEDYQSRLAKEEREANFLHPSPDLVESYAEQKRHEEAWEKERAEQTLKERLQGRGGSEGGTFGRERRKIGRNERVTIRNEETGAEETLKFKHAEKKLQQGWSLTDAHA